MRILLSLLLALACGLLLLNAALLLGLCLAVRAATPAVQTFSVDFHTAAVPAVRAVEGLRAELQSIRQKLPTFKEQP